MRRCIDIQKLLSKDRSRNLIFFWHRLVCSYVFSQTKKSPPKEFHQQIDFLWRCSFHWDLLDLTVLVLLVAKAVFASPSPRCPLLVLVTACQNSCHRRVTSQSRKLHMRCRTYWRCRHGAVYWAAQLVVGHNEGHVTDSTWPYLDLSSNWAYFCLCPLFF